MCEDDSETLEIVKTVLRIDSGDYVFGPGRHSAGRQLDCEKVVEWLVRREPDFLCTIREQVRKNR